MLTKTERLSVKRAIAIAQEHVLNHHPFLYSSIQDCSTELSDVVDTAAIASNKTICWNEEWTHARTPDELIYTVVHIAFLKTTFTMKQPDNVNFHYWNLAACFVVNQQMETMTNIGTPLAEITRNAELDGLDIYEIYRLLQEDGKLKWLKI